MAAPQPRRSDSGRTRRRAVSLGQMSTPRTTSRAMSALIGRAADMDVDEPPIVLLERSARAGRGNRVRSPPRKRLLLL